MKKLSFFSCNPLIDYCFIVGYDLPTVFFRANYGAVRGYCIYKGGYVLYHPELLRRRVLEHGYMKERDYVYYYPLSIDFMFLDGTLWRLLSDYKYEIQQKVYELLEAKGILRQRQLQPHMFCENGEEWLNYTYIKYLIEQYEKSLVTSNDALNDENILQLN